MPNFIDVMSKLDVLEKRIDDLRMMMMSNGFVSKSDDEDE